MHFGTCCTLQARGFGEMQGEECGAMLRKILEILLHFREVAGGPRTRESCKSRGWDDDALAPHRRYGFTLHPCCGESTSEEFDVAMDARARRYFRVSLKEIRVRGRQEMATSCR